MFGYLRNELVGELVEVLVPQRFRHGHADLRRGLAEAPQMRPMGTNRDLFGVRKDGSEFPVEVGLNSVAMSTGDVVVVTVVDITERKRTEDREKLLEHTRAKLEICQQLGIPAAVLQKDRRLVLLNPLMEGLRSQIVLMGDRIEFSNSMANEQFLRAVASLDVSGTDQIVRSIPITPDGSLPVIFHLLPLKGSLGSTLGILVVTTLVASDALSVDLVQGVFALTPAEARVAALIGSGLSPRQTAKRLGITEGNVRTTLKHVFEKVGVSRQNELAALLAKLALR